MGRTNSNPGALKALSAARSSPLPPAQSSLTKERLKEGAADTALNALSILRDTWEDFRRADRYFKYKAGIIAGWVLLSTLSIGVACPGGDSAEGATLVAVPNTSPTVWMVKNDGLTPWVDVVVVVNGTYRAAVSQLDANDGLTLSPKILVDSTGTQAPSSLVVRNLVLETADGRMTLMEDGEPTR
ncbi:MAG: hypothetical protein ACOZIN_01405 [Myxococcota bacterium]